MNFNYKLFFKYILFATSQLFLTYNHKNNNNLNIYISENHFYYLILHIKLSSLFYSAQLIEIFSYELPINKNIKTSVSRIKLNNENILTYNFHINSQNQRFFIFLLVNKVLNIKNKTLTWNSITSITELFLNANWLEREVSEMHSIFFSKKKDLRNLMLPYGDTSAPMKKSFPSIGLREIYYDSVTDSLIQTPVSIQF